MHSVMIKICGIRDPHMATQAVTLGANFIGILFHSNSPRFVTLDNAAEISSATVASGAIPVAVFVNHSATEMRHICDATHIRTVQLHGPKAKADHVFLPADYQRIYVQSVTQPGEIISEPGLAFLHPERDFMLIDHKDPGKGNTFDWLNFKFDLPFRWFLAGGLSPNNVNSAIKKLNPNGVDVSSGVERTPGKKDPILIESFIKTARGQTHVA
jgi:phosphoribosylanthranilate isomerase